MTTEEAEELVRECTAAYGAAMIAASNLGMMDVRAGLGGEYQLALARQEHAWKRLREAREAYAATLP